MKLGFFSPLPPSPTGVADYSATLLEAMQTSGEVVANAPGDGRRRRMLYTVMLPAPEDPRSTKETP